MWQIAARFWAKPNLGTRQGIQRIEVIVYSYRDSPCGSRCSPRSESEWQLFCYQIQKFLRDVSRFGVLQVLHSFWPPSRKCNLPPREKPNWPNCLKADGKGLILGFEILEFGPSRPELRHVWKMSICLTFFHFWGKYWFWGFCQPIGNKMKYFVLCWFDEVCFGYNEVNEERVLRDCWVNSERQLKDCWESAERLLRNCWETAERMLRECWENAERLLRDWGETEERLRRVWGETAERLPRDSQETPKRLTRDSQETHKSREYQISQISDLKWKLEMKSSDLIGWKLTNTKQHNEYYKRNRQISGFER